MIAVYNETAGLTMVLIGLLYLYVKYIQPITQVSLISMFLPKGALYAGFS